MRLPDWDDSLGALGRPELRDRTRSRAAIVAAAGLVWVVGGGLLLGLLGAAAAVALFGGAIVWIVSNSGRGMLRRARAVRLRPGTSPRLENVVAGVAESTGLPAPELWSIEDDAPNALVCFTKRPAIAVTTSLVERFTRTELEAVVAHCFVRLAETSSPLARTLLALSYVSPAFGLPVGDADDVRAAAITRYPPALAAAISKASPKQGRGASFWFVADDYAHVPPAERSAALLDL